ncbi:elongation factor P, partial [candidate division TA06 bacterium]|nr:elongation factor P [candidate division TA06 bacterium]
NGLHIRLDDEIFSILEFLHVKPGKGGAFVRTKLKNIRNGAVVEKTFRAGMKVDKIRLERRPMQYLYREGDQYIFMDQSSYEQISLSEKFMGDGLRFLKEAMNVEILFAEVEAVGVEFTTFAELKVVETDPGVKGNTASGGTKPAKVETGAVITVPLFIQEGDTVKIDTRTGEYIGRV